MSAPDDRVYSESHEWHMTEDGVVTIGITQFAVDQLTDVTFVEMKPVGTEVSPGDVIGEVESVKTTSDIYAHVAGGIVEVNADLESNPGAINEDPYGGGWLCKIRMSDDSGLAKLVDAQTYEKEHAV